MCICNPMYYHLWSRFFLRQTDNQISFAQNGNWRTTTKSRFKESYNTYKVDCSLNTLCECEVLGASTTYKRQVVRAKLFGNF